MPLPHLGAKAPAVGCSCVGETLLPAGGAQLPGGSSWARVLRLWLEPPEDSPPGKGQAWVQVLADHPPAPNSLADEVLFIS